jgi:hypothetical protein
VIITLCGAVCRVNDDGEALRPDGSPEAVTETEPLKPSNGVTDTCTVEEVPGAIEAEDGVTEMKKEGGGGGWLEDPPPQPYRKKQSTIAKGTASRPVVSLL